MSVVDNRVVEMQFDNSQFESNVQTSLSTIDKLKQSLNFEDSSKSFEQINAASNNVKFDGIAAGVDALQERFSTLGIVGMRVIENLTDSAMRFGAKVYNFMTSGIVQGGITRAMNLENAHFQLQGLLKDENAVSAVMKNVSDSVDGTAYSLDSAAKVASQLAASGMKAGDQMFSSLRAVAGVAAMTNSSYDDIGRIFTQVAGQGRLMGNDLLSLASRGMNAAAVLGKELGKTEAEIRDMVSDGKISFEMFASAMDKAFGEHAKKANETFTGSMANVKAALARIGAEFISPLIVQNGPLVKFFNTLRERVNDVKANIGPLADLFVNSVTKIANAATNFLKDLDLTNHFKAFYNVVDSLKSIFQGLASVLKPIGQAFLDIFPMETIGASIVGFTEKLKEVTSNLKLSDENAEKLRATFRGLFSIASGVIDVISSIVEALASLLSGNFDIAGVLLALTASLDSVGNSFKDFISNVLDKLSAIGPSVTKILDGLGNAFSNAKDAMSGFLDGNKVAEGSILVLLVYWLRRAIIVLKNFFVNITSFMGVGGINHMLSQLTDTLYQMENRLRYDAILKIAIALAVLAGSLLLLSTIDVEDLTKGVAAIGALLFMLTKAFNAITPLIGSFTKNGGGFKALLGVFGTTAVLYEMANAMVKLSISLLLLSFAVKNMASVDWGGLARGLIGVGVLLAELAVFTKFMDGTKLRNSIMSIIPLALGLLILTQAVKQLASLDLAGLVAGLAGIGVLLFTLSKFVEYNADAKGLVATGFALILMGTALNIFASAVKALGCLDLVTIGKGLLAMGASLAIVVIALKSIPEKLIGNMVSIGFGIVLMAGALKVMSSALTSLGGMSWDGIAKGLVAMAGGITILAVALRFMPDTLAGSAALLVASLALAVIAPVMKSLGGMSWESIAKGLITLAGAFAVIGVAGMLLGPLVPVIYSLSGAFALIGLGALALGAGLTMAGIGLTSISAGLAAFAGAVVANASAIVAGLTIIITGFIDLIPNIAKHLAEGIVTIIATLADSIGEIADALLKVITGVLDSLATYAPQIIASLVKFLVGIIDSLGDHIPELIQSFINFLGKLFQGIVDAFNSIDTGTLLQGTLIVVIMTGLMYGFAGIASLIPAAMAGVLGLGLVVTELGIVLAGIGGLAQIPGLKWLISEGGNLLQSIGTAIGQFIGGLVGGIANGFTSSLPQMATDISNFMTNIQPFINGANGIDPSMMDGVKSLAEAILIITAADVVDGLTSWLTGGNSLSDFAEQLTPFGEAIASFGESVKGIDPTTVEAAANAGKILAEMAATIPNSGGVLGFFAGENDMGTFASQLVPFGTAMKAYSFAVSGIDSDAIAGSATAAKSLVELASNLPNTGGLVSLFTGDNSLASFAATLIPFGIAMTAYSLAVAGINSDAVTASATAAKSIVELANNLPDTGGLISVFTGDNDLASFADKLIPFGIAMKAYSFAVDGINSDSVTASATAGKSLSELANNLPNTGGLVSIFTGDNDLASFANQLIPFGSAMKLYSLAVSGINADAVTDSATAGKALVELSNTLPNTGGLASIFTGDNDLTSFAMQLVPFGSAMKLYSLAVSGIDADAVTASATAGKALVELSNTLLNTGGLVSIFTGDNSLSSFATQLIPFGTAMKEYSLAVSGINADAVTDSATAGKALVELSNTLLNTGGLASMFSGENGLSSFATKLIPFGSAIVAYSKVVSDVDIDSVNTSVKAVESLIKVIDEMANLNSSGVSSFTNALKDLGQVSVEGFIREFQNGAAKVPSAVSGMINAAISSVSGAASRFQNAGSTLMIYFSSGINTQGSVLTSRFIAVLNNCYSAITSNMGRFLSGGMLLSTSLSKGILSGTQIVTKAILRMVTTAASNLTIYSTEFQLAGYNCAMGFARGIDSGSFAARIKAEAMARAAVRAAKNTLNEHSPSKVFYEIGAYAGEGFTNALSDYESKSYKSGYDMAENAKNGLSNAVGKISDVLNNDIDDELTIRPVVDLSNVQKSSDAIGNMFNDATVGVSASLDSISSMMNRNTQNGVNDDVVAAINKLNNSLNNLERPSYNINGITYDDGSNVANAIGDIVRAARIERRV